MGPGCQALDAHVGTEECIRTVHRDRCVVYCADTGMQIDWKLLGAPKYMRDPTVGPVGPAGSHSDRPTKEPSEPASHDVPPRYCLGSKARVKAKLDMSWAWKSCVMEKHGPYPSHIVKKIQICCLPTVCKDVGHPPLPLCQKKS